MQEKLKLALVILVALAVSAGAQTAKTVLNGLVYTFPTSDGTAGYVLLNDGSGGLSWTSSSAGGGATMPSNLIMFANGSCPSGYSEYTALQGRYVVGATANLTSTVGTALTSLENRATGNHTDHSISPYVNTTSGSHNHSVTDSGHTHASDTGGVSLGRAPEYVMTDPGPPEVWEWEPGAYGRSSASRNSANSGTGVSVNNQTISASGSATFTVANGGTGTGTNAPYMQLKACYKT
jgi:hypothetical protein